MLVTTLLNNSLTQKKKNKIKVSTRTGLDLTMKMKTFSLQKRKQFGQYNVIENNQHKTVDARISSLQHADLGTCETR